MSNQRYIRQTTLKDFGNSSQEALAQAKVLVIGAGGLGCPALQYLASMGIGLLGIVDNDIVSLSNLHRQILFGIDDVGQSKVEVAANKLTLLNNEVKIKTYQEKLTQVNAFEIIADYDVITDCSDNFSTRYMVNDACVLLKKPLVYAAVSGYEGQIATFNYRMENGQFSGNYRDIYPKMPKDGEIQNCAEAGILGILPGIIGTMQASEVVKIITNFGQPLYNKLLCYNLKQQQSMSFEYKILSHKNEPKSLQDFLTTNYELACDILENSIEINQEKLQEMLNDENTICIDVRNNEELPSITKFNHKKIVLSNLSLHFNEIEKGNIIFICQSGKRSLDAARIAKAQFNEDRFYSLKGGVMNNDIY